MPLLVNGDLKSAPFCHRQDEEWTAHLVWWAESNVRVMVGDTIVLTGPDRCAAVHVTAGEALHVAVGCAAPQWSGGEAEFVKSAVELLREREAVPKSGPMSELELCALAPTPELRAITAQLLAASDDVKTFKKESNGNPTTYAKAKKDVGGPHKRAPCPPLATPLDMGDLCAQVVSSEPLWRQAAASFSTMMRFFLRYKKEFRWDEVSPDHKQTWIVTL